MEQNTRGVETFLTIDEFLSKFGREHEFRNWNSGWSKPLRLIAGGSGLEFEFRNALAINLSFGCSLDAAAILITEI